MPSLKVLVEEIKRIKSVANTFNKYIDYIRFPNYRNLEVNTKITFDFPLTIFVGQNGSGKSSALQALYGAPRNNSIGEYWFSTVVDPINENTEEEKNRIIYAFVRNANQVEVIKQRSPRENDPDYWETARPIQRFGMTPLRGGRREAPLEMDVTYLDFRAELSAFDKYFYFKDETKLYGRTKQDYLRRKSKTLNEAIITNREQYWGAYKQSNRPINLTDQEILEVSTILGKNYLTGKIINHKFFENWGNTVIFKTDFASYSEAFAGSGEIAIVRLVHEVLEAPNNSLILLDEPEVSLHPGAQNMLKSFILNQIKRKKLQVVISTHSPNLIEGLPSNAIKVFTQLPNGKFHVDEERTPSEAFYYLGLNLDNRKKIIVEDELSKLIIDDILHSMGAATFNLFDVEYFPGGHTVLKNSFIPIYSQEDSDNKIIILDGDQKIVNFHFDPDSIIEADQTEEKFRTEILNQTGINIHFNVDGNPQQGGNQQQKIALMKKYLKYYLLNVFYLPKRIPEDILWNEELAKELLTTLSVPVAEINEILSAGDSKVMFLRFTLRFAGNTTDMKTIYRIFLNKWLLARNEDYDNIFEVIDGFRNR